MKDFKINIQQINFLHQALNEGTFPFPAKNIKAIFDMLNNLEEIKAPEEEKKE